MKDYLRLLRRGDFARLWWGSSASLLGDGMTVLALSWLVLDRGGPVQLGLLGVCLTAPVLLGGLAVGPLLDRFDARLLLGADSLFRAVLVATVPLAAALGDVPTVLPFVVAFGYGLLKMVPLAGFPTVIPRLVDPADLSAANALESLSFSVATVVGPVAAGFLIAAVGAPNVLLVDAASFLVLAAASASVRRSLAPRPGTSGTGGGWGTALRTVAADRVIVATTVAFMAFNVAEGMLLVVGPWLARTELAGGAVALGVLVSAAAVGEVVGAALAGARAVRPSVRLIGAFQVAAALAFLGLLAAPDAVGTAAAFFAVGLLSAPMTVLAQSLRMHRIPPELHGRSFTALRTLMQGTVPLGAVIVAPLLAGGGVLAAAVGMAVLAGLPGLGLLLPAVGRGPETGPGPGTAPRTEPA